MNWKYEIHHIFQELAKVQQQILSKQQPVSLEKAKEQVATLKKISSQKVMKQRG